MNTFKSGRRVSARSAADSSCCRNGVAPAIWVQRSPSISATAAAGSHRSIEYRGGAQQQRAFEGVDRAADVGDGRRNQERVARIDVPVVADLADQRVYRIMAVQNAFRAASGAGRVEDHPHGIGIQRGQLAASGSCSSSARIRRVRAGFAAQHHHLGGRAHRGGHAFEHRRVVMAAELAAGTKIIAASTSSRMKRRSWSRSDGRIGFTTIPASVAAR